MARTVYYVTNRVVTGDDLQWQSYGTDIVAPSDPTAMTYGTAFVDDSNLTADSAGSIISLQDVGRGHFSAAARDDLASPGCNLLIFIHGFDNSFNDGITRAAFLQQWFAASGLAGANTAVIAFAWPSLGKLIGLPILWEDYQRDQEMAGQCGVHLMDMFAQLRPILSAARSRGSRVILLAHSMGTWALQAGVASWFLHNNGSVKLFEDVVLAASDERCDSFGMPPLARLSGLHRLTGRTSFYFSRNDAVLQLSMTINGKQRLGQDGPLHRTDQTQFPPGTFRMVDCTSLTDYDWNVMSSHQYYRRSPSVRADIAAILAGGAV